jgi:CHAT domain-containing protein
VAATGRTLLSLVIGLLLATNGVLGSDASLLEQGQRAYERGAFDQAAGFGEKAVEAAHKKHDTHAEIQASVRLADAYQSLGQHRRAVQLLQRSLDTAEKARDAATVTLVKARLGACLILTLDYAKAESLLRESLQAAQAAGNSQLAAAILNDLGNSLAAQQKYAEALASFQQCLGLARQGSNSLMGAQALCNAASTAVRAKENQQAADLNADAFRHTESLGPSHAKAFLLLTIGQTGRRIQLTNDNAQAKLRQQARQSFERALEVSEKLKDGSAQSYALGYLAELDEEDGQTDDALSLNRRAVFTAQQAQIPEALYRWEWQTGRLLKRSGQNEPAIEAYRRAIQTLQPIRNDVSLGYGNATVRLPFRESQGPLFFQLADLLLEQAKSSTDPNQSRDLVLQARDTVEQLKAVELEDYFHDDCVNVQKAQTRSIESVDAQTAVIYLIPLAGRTEILVGLTSGLKRFTVDVGADALASEVRQFRRNLETRTTFGYLEQAQHLYDWLIRPIRPLLNDSHINTLVFVPDGALRTIPLATLQDGERFLIQDFAVAVAPGLSLVQPRPIQREKVNLLLSGLSESVQGFPPLKFVTGELQSVEPLYPSEVLENQSFTLKDFREKLTDEQFSIVHIASHGQFDRDVTKTFVLTYDKKLTLNDLESLIRPGQYRGRPVELLVLSACQTAAGDDRAALGLAGVAVKAGARSALATLWFVNDQSTSTLITEFYSQLRNEPSVSKARSLQLAQIKLLGDRRYRHPCYWSPYLIIGNWL